MFQNSGFAPKYLRADETGYFVVFEGSVQGESQTRSCYGAFQGCVFRGALLQLKLGVRGGH